MIAARQFHHKAHPCPLLPLLFVGAMLVIAATALAATPVLTPMGEGLVHDSKSGLVWQMERSRKVRTPAEAEQYLAQLNQGTFHDWRLPTKWELYDLFSVFDLKKNGEVKLKLEGSYWLKEENGAVYPGSWETGDQCGPERAFFKTKSGYVRAVRP